MHKNRNVTHRNTNNGLMKRGELKPNAVPSVWPGCPTRLTKTKNERPTKMATSQARDEHETAVRKELLEEHIREATFDSLDGLQVKFDVSSLPDDVTMIRNKTHAVFLNLCTEEKPTTRYCLKLNAALEYEMWWNGEVLNSNCIDNVPALLTSCSMIETIINCLSNLKESNVTDDETLREIIDRVDDMEHHEKKKLSFFIEQLSSILIKDPRRCRYSCDLLNGMYVAKCFSCFV